MGRSRTIEEPARRIPVMDGVDVLVAGGGPAGIAAALAAAHEGARTLLVERYGYLGGMITGAHVVAILGVGDGTRPLARGIVAEIHRRLEPLGGVEGLGPAPSEDDPERASRRDSGDYRVDAELFKWQAAEMLREAGVELLLHTLVCRPVIQDGRVSGAFVESKSGRQAILAQVTIDGTADADLAYRAGVPCDNETHDVTLVTRVEGVDRERVEAFAVQEPDAYAAIMAEAARLNGDTPIGKPRYLKQIDVTDASELTRAEIQLRREAFETLRYLQSKLPGYEQAHLAITYPQLGVRQSRRIHGEYTLVDDDLIASRHFGDGIARLGVYFPDWGPIYQRKGLAYDIPYRCLVPENVEGLLVAGRSISCDYRTCNTMRLIVPCFVTGQAAGAAAAIAVELGRQPRAIPTETLRQALAQQGAYLG
ncbi:MAG: FAD-dependent oxidoreductase [Anaerolineae bacterium]|nr:FAD-dependent oxidoreductase [Anaerolineae bacterium]